MFSLKNDQRFELKEFCVGQMQYDGIIYCICESEAHWFIIFIVRVFLSNSYKYFFYLTFSRYNAMHSQWVYVFASA